MAGKYRVVLPDGQAFGWGDLPERLQAVYPGARITGELVLDEIGQGVFLPSTGTAPPIVAAPAEGADPEKSTPEDGADLEKAPRKAARA